MLKEQTLTQFLEEEIANIDKIKAEIIGSEKSTNQLIGSFLSFLLESEGKKLRPKLTVLCANLFGKPNRSTYLSAILLEILHQATLLHDDVVDEAKERRGEVSANIKFGNKSSVLMGDYLLSKMIEACAVEKEFKLLEILSTTLVSLSKGELVQLNADADAKVTTEQLLQIAKMKTGSLISASCISGAYATNASEQDIEKVKQFGDYFGLAYQIKDDMLDYLETNKEQFKDLKERKINIPLSLALTKAPEKQQNEILSFFNKETFSENEIQIVAAFIKEYKGMEQANDLYHGYIQKALDSLETVTSNEKEYLVDFVNGFVEREF